MRFWLDMGVDGMRLDAVPYLVEREGTQCANLPETHAILKAIRRELDSRHPGRMLLAEANQWPSDVRAYFGDGDECHMAFHFPLMPRLFMALRQEDRHPISEILYQMPEIPDICQWAIFLRNHDELTLEMVSDDERDYMYQAYAADPQMRVNAGIRRRLAPLMENSRPRIELLTGLLLSLPGTPVLYYGDELGMGDNVYLGDRNGVRTPMQWNADRNGGFSRADPARLYAPPIMDSIYGFGAVNVEAQDRSPHSLLAWMRRIVGLRQRHVATFGRGTPRAPAAGKPAHPGVHPPVRSRRSRARGREPLADGAGRLARPRAPRGAGPDRDVRRRGPAAHHRRAVHPHPRTVCVLLASPAARSAIQPRPRAGGRSGRARAGTVAAARRSRVVEDFRRKHPHPVGTPAPLAASSCDSRGSNDARLRSRESRCRTGERCRTATSQCSSWC